MRAVISIGEKDVPMVSNGAIDIIYRQVFHEDIVKLQYEMGDDDIPGLLNCMMKMGFIMAKAAELDNVRELMQLTEDDFVEWLMQFDRAQYIEVLPKIRDVYEGQQVTTAESKKNPDPPSDQ